MTDTHETQHSINEWQLRHFPDATIPGILEHLREEFEEFLDAPTLDLAAIEAADIVIILYDWAQRNGVDLHNVIDIKMARNRQRRWEIQPDGTGRHIKI